MTPKGATLEATDLIEISEDSGGGTYVTKSITGAEIMAAAMAGVDEFIELTDVPATYVGQGGKTVKVNVGETALEFATATSVNIATNDLVFPANSITDLDGYKATLDNAELKIIADADTSGNVPFSIRNSADTDDILKVTGDKDITATGNFTQTSGGNITHALSGGQCFITMTTSLTSGNFTADNFGNFYVQNTANGGFLHLRTTGTSGVIDISSSGIIRVLNGLPVYADDTAAGAGGVIANQLYKTATGEIRIKL